VAGNGTIAALAGQVDDLRGTVARLHTVVTQWNARLETEGIGATLVLRREVKRLADVLDQALSKNRLSAPQAPCWAGLTGDESSERLVELRGWVETFRVHYPDYAARLRPCWANHTDAVWESSTLMTEWLRVYTDELNQNLAGALWWHERWFPGVLTRLDQAIRCDEASCRVTRRR
jgi:hypothetical protein